jgi:hypothetical protein
MKQIFFKDIVKKIHPDLNPNIKNASEKMNDILLYKNNPRKLYHLAVKWGLLSHTKPFKKFEWVWTPDKNREIQVNDNIFHLKKEIIVIVEKITSKRYYYYLNGHHCYCKKEDAVFIKKIKKEVK